MTTGVDSSVNIHWKDWCWSWSSNTLATWCKELTHWKRPWCWERLRAGGAGGNRGWEGWMKSPSQWTWVWVNKLPEIRKDREAWHAAVHGVAKSQTRLNHWTTLMSKCETHQSWASPSVTGLREEASPHPLCSLSIPITHISTGTGPTVPIHTNYY